MNSTRAATSSTGEVSGVRRAPQQETFLLPFSLGEVICGRYEVTGLLGIGGVGFVISALDLELRAPVALKFLHRVFLSKSDIVARFAHEAQSAAKIESPHIVRVFDVGHLPGHGPFIVMELLNGRDLGQLISKRGAVPQQRAVSYVLQACEALAAAHAQRVIHRDVKPDNLFIASQPSGHEVVKLLDFGISKSTLGACEREPRLALTQVAQTVGSPPYMSPEQIRGVSDIDPRTDVWSLGCVLYELLTGRPAFDAPLLIQVCAVVLEHKPSPPTALNPRIPFALEAAVLRCLEKDRELRFADVGELARAIAPFAGPASRADLALAPAPPAPPPHASPAAARAPSGSVPVPGKVPSTSPPTPLPNGAPAAVAPELARSSQPTIATRRIAIGRAVWLSMVVAFVLVSATAWIAAKHAPAPTRTAAAAATTAQAAAKARAPGAAASAATPGMQSPLAVVPPVPAALDAKGAAPSGVLAELAAQVVPARSPALAASDLALAAAAAPMPRHARTLARGGELGEHGVHRAARVESGAVTHAAYAQVEPGTQGSHSHAGDEPSAPPPPTVAPAPMQPPALALPNGLEPVSLAAAAANALPVRQPAAASVPQPASERVSQPAGPHTREPSTPVTEGGEPASDARASERVTSAATAATVRAHADEVELCFERARMEHADLHGEIVLRASLDESGHVTKASTSSSVDDGARLAVCIRTAARRWKFPAPADAAHTGVSYKFVFE